MDQIQRYQQLNENATTPDQYTVFFLGRHGEGYRPSVISDLFIHQLTGPLDSNLTCR